MAKAPLINGKSYSWSMIELNLFGRVVEGITSIEWKTTFNKENNYGRGTKPVSRGEGKEEYSGKITLEAKEVQAIRAKLPPGAKLGDIPPFPIVISYVDENAVVMGLTLVASQFLEDGASVAQGDTNTYYEIPLILGDVVYF